jgi:hypothetical protein
MLPCGCFRKLPSPSQCGFTGQMPAAAVLAFVGAVWFWSPVFGGQCTREHQRSFAGLKHSFSADTAGGAELFRFARVEFHTAAVLMAILKT